MNEHFCIKMYTNPSGQQVWRVQGRMPDGKRVRQNFQEHPDAVARKAELEIQALNRPCGTSFKQTRLTNSQLVEAEAAFMKLGGKPLLPAVDFFLTHERLSLVDISVREASLKFTAAMRSQKKLRDRTLEDYESRLGPLGEFHGEQSITTISRTELEPLIFKPGQAADTTNGNRRVLHAFFAWCLRQGYLDVNPVSKIETAARDENEPEVLSLTAVKLLLRAALTYKGGKMLPYVVLGLFMGLRPEETARLLWKHVDLEQMLLRIQGDVAKLRYRRIIEMPGTAAEWLQSCYGKPIIPKNMRRDWDAVRLGAGYKPSYRMKGDSAELKDWPQDVVRHTALSCHYAFGKDEDATAYWAGNSPETLLRFYRGLVTPQDAKEFWSLTPANL